MRRSFVFLAAFAAVFSLLSSAQAEEFSRSQIEKIVHEYLVSHPEVIEEALVALRQQQAEEASARGKKLVQEHRKQIFEEASSPSIGTPDAPVTLVEFFDYNCGACKIMFNSLDTYLKEKKNKNELRVVFKEYPIFGEDSAYPAKMALAVHRLHPEKYFAYHSGLMAFQGRVTPETVDEVLKKIGVDAAEARKESEKPEVEAILKKNTELAATLEAGGTPLLVLGDETIPHALGVDELKKKIAEAAEKK
jgi:protein-disulfide isomerase